MTHDPTLPSRGTAGPGARHPESSWHGWVVVGLIAAACVVAYMAWPFPPQRSARSACINHLRQIDGAKDYFAAVHGRYPSSLEELVPDYMKSMPVCPRGGTRYTIGGFTENPTCDLCGDLIPGPPITSPPPAPTPKDPDAQEAGPPSEDALPPNPAPGI